MRLNHFWGYITGMLNRIPVIFLYLAVSFLLPFISPADEVTVISLAEEPRRPFLGQGLPFYEKLIKPVNIAAAGDLMLGSWIVEKMETEGVDSPYDSTRSLLLPADVAVANLEAPLADNGSLFVEKQYTFKVPTRFVSGICNAGFDVLTLANNHILDYGCEGLSQTLAAVKNAGIALCGAGMNREAACAPAMIEVNGLIVAIVGFSMTYPDEFWATPTRCGTCHPSEEMLFDAVSACEMDADLTIVNIHWGTEKKTAPNPYQVEMAHRLIDLGADLVLGHHPHVLQGLELYRGKLIAYSLGNYIFGSISENAKTSMILQIALDMNGLLSARVNPIHVYNAVVKFQPKILRGDEKKAVLEELRVLSRALNSGRDILDLEGTILPATLLAQQAQ